MDTVGFSRFVAIDEVTAPDIFRRVANEDLPFDSSGIEQKTHVRSRLIANPEVDVELLAVATIRALSDSVRFDLADVGGLVLASCTAENIQKTAESAAQRLGMRGEVRGIDVACSGFTAGTELARSMALTTQKPVLLVTSEITSRMINWEKTTGGILSNDDEKRARGKAAKIFGDGSAAVLLKPPGYARDFDILDAFAYDMEDPDHLLTLSPVSNASNIDGSIREGNSPCINMPGRAGAKLMKQAPIAMSGAVRMSIQRALRSGLMAKTELLRHVVHHQANGAMVAEIKSLLHAMHYDDIHVWNEIAHQGNVSAASIPVALQRIQDTILSGEIVAMPSIGAGSPSFRDGWLSTGCVLARKAHAKVQ